MFKNALYYYSAFALIVTKGNAEDPFFFQTPTFEGSGCPSESVQIVTSSDYQTVSVLFSDYNAETSSDSTFDRKSCNLAVSVDVASGYSMGIIKVDYRGYAYVPKDSEATFTAEYFFAGINGPVVKRDYSDYDDDIYITNDVGITSVVWSACGSSTIFRINTSIIAKKDKDKDDNVYISIDTTDMTVSSAFNYYITMQECEM